MNAMDAIASNKTLLLTKIGETVITLKIEKPNILTYSHYNSAFAIALSDNVLIIVYGDSSTEYNFYPIRHTTTHIYT